jgi:hypothetical protein
MRATSIAIGLLLALGGCGSCGPSERDLWVVNNSGVEFTVVIDGKEVPPPIVSATTEGAASVRRVKVKPGDHVVEARFADGKKMGRGIMFSQQTSGYVFAPRRNKTLCFFVVGPNGETALDHNDEILGLPHVLDHALEPGVGQTTDDHTLRMKPCGG